MYTLKNTFLLKISSLLKSKHLMFLLNEAIGYESKRKFHVQRKVLENSYECNKLYLFGNCLTNESMLFAAPLLRNRSREFQFNQKRRV